MVQLQRCPAVGCTCPGANCWDRSCSGGLIGAGRSFRELVTSGAELAVCTTSKAPATLSCQASLVSYRPLAWLTSFPTRALPGRGESSQTPTRRRSADNRFSAPTHAVRAHWQRPGCETVEITFKARLGPLTLVHRRCIAFAINTAAKSLASHCLAAATLSSTASAAIAHNLQTSCRASSLRYW